MKRVFTSLWVCAFLLSVALPAPDAGAHDSDEFQEIRDRTFQLVRDGDLESAAESFENLYQIGLQIAPRRAAEAARAASSLAGRRGRLAEQIEWIERAIAAQQDAQAVSPDLLLSDVIKLSQLRDLAGDRPGAMEAMELAARVVRGHEDGSINPYKAYQVLFQLGQLYIAEGLHDRVAPLYEEAELYLIDAGRGGGREHLMLRIFSVDDGEFAGPDTSEKLRALMDVYEDPTFRELPDRLSLAGRFAGAVAYTIGDYATLERLATDLFAEAARLEGELGRESANRADIDGAYMQTAYHLAWARFMTGDFIGAAEAAEHALHAYPSHELADRLLDVRSRAYEQAGIDPASREVDSRLQEHSLGQDFTAEPPGVESGSASIGQPSGHDTPLAHVDTDDSGMAVQPRQAATSGKRWMVAGAGVCAVLLLLVGWRITRTA